MENKPVIIFDFDGVIVDSVLTMYQHTKKRMKFLPWGLYQVIFDNPLFMKVLHIRSKLLKKDTDKKELKLREDYAVQKLEVALVPGMGTVIEKLSKSYTLAINTNASNETCIPILQKYHLTQYFAAIKTRDDALTKTEKNNQIIDELNLDVKRTLFITDSYRDVLAAKESGIRSIGILTGVHDEKHFKKSNVQKYMFSVVKDSKELETSIKKYFN